ncbi:MAG: methyl-accepting chemotaxis protein [Thiotrichales bacterium]
MKRNLPVTQREVVMKDGSMLVSKTDLKGRITYCNSEFIEISGFTEGELIGKSHNIVRHPDMPPAAFEDMWRTIKQGKPWEGLVKNRCKAGDFYWVKANVAPISENGKVIGFMSLRLKPSREEIQAAESLYKELNTSEQAATRYLNPRRTIKDRIQAFSLATLLKTAAFGIVLFQSAVALLLLFNAPKFAVWAVLLATVGFALWASRAIYQRVSRPLSKAVNKINLLSEGRYFEWCDFSGDDEFTRLNAAIRISQIKLGFDMTDTTETVRKLLILTSHLGSVASNFQATAASMEESAANITEINSLVRNNSTNTQDADVTAKAARENAEQGGQVLSEVQVAMERISTASLKIKEIISVIDEIAFKTNLLALNAAVEAAHAGDQGRGFAVVADEVRNLSQHTTNAATQVKALIEDTVLKVEEGTELVDGSGVVLGNVIGQVNKVSELLSEISLAGREQAIGVDALADNIQVINERFQETNDLIETTYHQSQYLGRAIEGRAGAAA